MWLRNFLNGMDGLNRKWVLLNARYQKFWMPLVADSLKFDALLNVDSKGKSLLPPLDVQWVWHCHRLNPV